MSADLIERLEKAEEGSRQLDAEIWFAVLAPVVNEKMGYTFIPNADSVKRAFHENGLPILIYTRSIDDALALVPAHWGWRVSRTENGLHSLATVCRSYPTNHVIKVEANTPALALCIACLRARAAATVAT